MDDEIKKWLEKNIKFHRIEDGGLIIVKSPARSGEGVREKLVEAFRKVRDSLGKNVMVLVLTEGWDACVERRDNTKKVLLEMLGKLDEGDWDENQDK